MLDLKFTEYQTTQRRETDLAHPGRGTGTVGKRLKFARLTRNPIESGDVGGQKHAGQHPLPPHATMLRGQCPRSMKSDRRQPWAEGMRWVGVKS